MKKIVSLMTIAFIAIILMVSCEQNKDVAQPDNSGKVSINTTVSTNAASVFKSVDRGNVPVYVKGVNVTVSSDNFIYNVNKEFLYEIGGTDEMMIENVALGQNTISAVSLPIDGILPHTFIESQSTENNWSIWGGIISGESNTVLYSSFNTWYLEVEGQDTFLWWTTTFHNFMKDGFIPVNAMTDFISYIIANERDQDAGAPIYAIYNGMSNVTVTHTTPAVADVVMTTNNGRQMVTFTVDDLSILDNYDITIIGDCSASPQVNADGPNNQVQLDSDTPFAVSYWSNAAAEDGAVTNYVIEFREKGNSDLLRTINVGDIAVQAGYSWWTNVVIYESAFKKGEQGLVFNYIELIEADDNIDIIN